MINIDKQEAEEGKVISIFAYIIFLIPLLAGKDNRFAQFHANQGLVLFLTSVAVAIVSNILSWILWPIGFLVSTVGSLGILALAIIGIINVVNLEAKPLPVIGGITLIKSY
jgi:uncharacterized membrane protein